jgi:hypothetical protein
VRFGARFWGTRAPRVYHSFYAFGPANEGRTPGHDSLLTITLRPVSGCATALTLVHERLDDLAAAMPHVGDKVEVGWESVLEKLAVTLGATAVD